jgi:Phage endonuclease I
MFICKFCQKECKSANSQRNHERLCHSNPNRQISSFTYYNYPSRPAWNKGLSQEDFPSLARPNQRGKKFGSALTGHTEETKRKISQKLSINNKGGRSKWYEVAGQKVQGTWERNVALKFEELGIKWKKLKTNRDVLEYIMDNKVRCYTPDFYLPAYNVYLEVKGHWWGRDREKMDIVLKTHPDKNIVIVEKEQYEKFLGGELVW